METQRGKRAFRILICSTALSFGGEQKQISKVIRYLEREQFQPIICCIRPHGYIDTAIGNSDTEIIDLQTHGRYNLFGAVRGLCRVIKQRNIDLIHMGIFGAEFAAPIAALIKRIPVVALLATMYDIKERLSASPAKNFTPRLKWWVIRQVHAVLSRLVSIRYVAYSAAIKESAVKNLGLPADRVEIIPLGTNPEDFGEAPAQNDPQLKSALHINGTYPVLLNVARLSPVKGQKELLEAMPRVLEHFPKTRLLIAGDGPLHDELEGLVGKLGLRKHVSLLGRRDDVASLLSVSDIFVFSSYYEGLPGAVIEAMAAGKPVVAFDIPALHELVVNGRSGLLVHDRDKEHFAYAIVEVARKGPHTREMGERGRQIVKEHFDIKQNVKALERLYLKMLQRAAPGSEINP